MWFGRGTRPLPTTVLAWSQVSTLDAFDGDSNGQNDDDDDDDDVIMTMTMITIIR